MGTFLTVCFDNFLKSNILTQHFAIILKETERAMPSKKSSSEELNIKNEENEQFLDLTQRQEMGNAIRVGSTSPYTHTAPGLHTGTIEVQINILVASFLSQSDTSPADSLVASFSFPPLFSSSSSPSGSAYTAGTIDTVVVVIVIVKSTAIAITKTFVFKFPLLFM
jgi:hypothetical protein